MNARAIMGSAVREGGWPLAEPMPEGQRWELRPCADDWQDRLKRRLNGGNLLVQALQGKDKRLELVYQPVLERWVLYRVRRYGAVPSEDELVFVHICQGLEGEAWEPGLWLIRWLDRYDAFKNCGSVERAKHQVKMKLKHDRWCKAEEQQKKRKDMMDDMKDNIGKYYCRDAKSVQAPSGLTMTKPKVEVKP